MTTRTWQDIIKSGAVAVSDGAWGTELARRGLPAGTAPEKWNLDRPEAVGEVARAYVEAGSHIVLTNTFGGSRYKLAKVGLADDTVEVNLAGARISVQAAEGRALVFASLGPTGEFLEPLGTLSESELIAAFAEQAQAVAAGHVDGIVIETMTDLGEAKAACRAAKDSTDLPVVVSMTFEKGARGYATMMGVTPEQAAAELSAAGADAVGANCGAGIVQMVDVARLMQPHTNLPLWFKANAGLPELVDGQTVFRQTPEEMAAHVADLIDAGARVIGGCCGTTPDHIRAVVNALP